MNSSKQLIDYITKNKTLRSCQKESLKQITTWYRDKKEESFLACLPTGTGKTGVIAITSGKIVEGNVLIVTPWANLRSQMVRDLEEKFWDDSSIKKPEGFITKGFSGKDLSDLINSNEQRSIWVTTFQGLWTISSDKDLYKQLSENIDLVIIDEGHYEPAMWWGRAIKKLKTRTLLLTATPYRNDLKYFRIDDSSVYHYLYKKGVKDGVIRNVKVNDLGEEDNTESAPIINAIKKKWSPSNKKSLAHPKPRMIVCCPDFSSVVDYTLQLNKKGLNAIGIHHRATKKYIEKKNLKYFRSRVPKDVASEKADIWVHERILTEGLDYSNFCAIVITWQFRNDRRLIQQIGRIVRSDAIDVHNNAIVYEVKGAEVEATWKAFLDFEDNFNVVTSEFYRNFVTNHLNSQPDVEYFGKRFRRQLVPMNIDANIAKNKILAVPSIIVRNIPTDFVFSDFVSEVTDSLHLEDFITIGPRPNEPIIVDDNVVMWLYCRLGNSKTLLSHSAYEIKISALTIVKESNYLFVTDTDGYLPSDSMNEHTKPITIEKLNRVFGNEYVPTQVQLTNSLPHQSVIRSTVRSGPNLQEVPISLSESKYLCNSIRGRNNEAGRRYIGFKTSRISDEMRGVKRNEICLSDLIDWCLNISKTLDQKRETNPFFLRYARLKDKPDQVIPKYGFLDFWSGAIDLFDDSKHILDPTDAVFEFKIEKSLTKFPDIDTFSFEINAIKGRKKYTSSFLTYWKDNRFHFKAIDTGGLLIGEDKNGVTKYTDIAKYCSRKQGDIFISLDKSNLVYNSNSFFQIDPTSNYSDIANIFEAMPELGSNNLSEKNSTKKRKLKSWQNNTLFNLISTNPIRDREFGYSPDLVLCDDGPGEIADFLMISFDRPKFIQVHCKNKVRSGVNFELQATSELQEVVSQASKNLVYASGRSSYPSNIKTWTKKGKVHGFSVPRILKKKKGLPEGKKLWDKISEEILLSRNTQKEVWIISGGAISKSWVDNEIEKCKNVDSSLACLFHMIDGLAASCTEADVKLKIYVN